MNSILESIIKNRIIAILRSIEFEKLKDTVTALEAGGIKLMEVTFNQASETGEEDTVKAIKFLSEYFGDRISIGAGTVLTVKQAEMAIEAGAKYIISPDTNIEVIQKTIQMNAISMPGALTPTEVVTAYQAGAHFVKLFPAGDLGIDYIKSVKAPLNHIPIMAVGGIDHENLAEYLKAGVAGVGVGSSLVNKKLIDQGQFDALTGLAIKFTSQL